MSGILVRFPHRFVPPRDERAKDLRLRAAHHFLLAEALEFEAQVREWGFGAEVADFAPIVEESARSLHEFERRVAGGGG